MEIPDVIAVNKSDHPLIDTMVREIEGVFALGPREGWQVPDRWHRGDPWHRRRGARGEAHRAYIKAEGTLSERPRRNVMNEVLAIATFRMRRELEAYVRDDPAVTTSRSSSRAWSARCSSRCIWRAAALARRRRTKGAARSGRLARARSRERRNHDPRWQG
jgi:hypothetical protein